ncbi:hypothetical protein V5F38_05230 [Xanthobacter sp. V0B-10]|uniref:LexA family protein n=1 Tax=Xanthobacter albus TaxID=3119929 RepID=UPI00372AC74C
MNKSVQFSRNRMFRAREKQEAVLAYVAAFIMEHRAAPTYRQIAAATGVALSSVGRQIAALRSRGALSGDAGKHKSLSLPNRDMGLHLHLHPEVVGELVMFATRQGISVETAAAEAIRAYVGAAA